MSDLVLTPEEMVAELQYRSEIIKELVETNGVLRDENEKLRAALKQITEKHAKIADEIAYKAADYCDEEMSAVDAGYVVASGIAAALKEAGDE